MRVVATAVGYFGARRRPGDVFDVPEGTKGSWFVEAPAPVDPAPVVEEAEKPKAGKTKAAKAAPEADDLTD